jgi:hypothetical protein
VAGFSVSAENLAVDAISGSATSATRYISLHSQDPGATGTSGEISGGTYARKGTTFNAAANSSSTGSNVTLDVPSGVSITYWGLWTAASGGTFLYGGQLPAAETFGSNGTYTLTPTLSATDVA